MTDLHDLDDLIAGKMFEAHGDAARLQDLMAALLAGLGLTIALASEGDPNAASHLCEQAAHQVFVQASENAAMAADMRRLT
ncbi:hypothetical protein [Methylobacterium sp.]|uniref:hypothetical protein n=1 Tax=Methylobacterium sp. TaxID=409 RepID=UPI0025D6D855|nr:hypothetical protein [Methylobacterium sp.]MBY0256226.1 hypothetical protein [Methylobacterium sp.]